MTYKIVAILVSASTSLFGGEGRIKMKDLPAPVQKTVRQETQNAKLVGLAKEKEGGKMLYELETNVNGKSRDLMIDSSGAIQSVEDEVDLESIPAAAKAAITKIAGAKVDKVEKVTKGSEVSYEAAYTTKGGKKTEFAVNADGTAHK